MGVNLQTIKDIRNYLTEELGEIYTAREIKSITDLILTSVLGIDKIHLLSRIESPVTRKQKKAIINISKELKSGKPIQYIIGETLFYNCRIRVDESVLIPRPETEELVDLIIKENEGFQGKILDIGTGSGCIAIALAKNLRGSEITATDVSANSLATAAKNAKFNGVEISFVENDILNEDLTGIEKTDIIVSNPPYVMDSEKEKMNRNILGFEPHNALFVPDNDPLKFYRSILKAAENKLIPKGRIYFEINETKGNLMADLLKAYKYSGVSIVKDINGKDRIAKGYKK